MSTADTHHAVQVLATLRHTYAAGPLLGLRLFFWVIKLHNIVMDFDRHLYNRIVAKIVQADLDEPINSGHDACNHGDPEYHRAFGKHSGIPECCTEAWIAGGIAERRETLRQAKKDRNDKTHWGYIPCDKCIATWNRVPIHRCQPGCGVEAITGEECAQSIFEENKQRGFW